MSNKHDEIKLLCPSSKCKKCRRIIDDIEKIIEELDIVVDFEVVTEIDDLLKLRAWIFPTLFVNGVKIYEGYVPKHKFLKSKLTDLLMK